MKMTFKTREILGLLRQNAEGEVYETTDGRRCRDVYLDNARPDWMPPRQFAGCLGVLEQLGFYKSHGDGAFGLVILED